MSEKKLTLFALLLLISEARAQEGSLWITGVKLGVAQDKVVYGPNSVGYWSMAPAITLGCRIGTRKSAALCTDLQYSKRYVEGPGYNFISSNNLSYLSIPLYIRTGPIAKRVHLLIGGGFSTCLDKPVTYSPGNSDWNFNPDEVAGLLGAEARLFKTKSMELALGASGRWGFTPMFNSENPRYRRAIYNRQVTISTNLYLNFIRTRKAAE